MLGEKKKREEHKKYGKKKANSYSKTPTSSSYLLTTMQIPALG